MVMMHDNQGSNMSARITGLLPQVSMAHLVSHFHIMALPAMFPILPEFLGVGYFELGVALSVFNLVSIFTQAPMGFVVDHYGPRRMLIGGITLGSISFLLVALFPSYLWLLIAMVFAGIANAVYHPANYALLSQGIRASRMGRAFSLHTFAGCLGAAIAPGLLLGIAAFSEPRLAFVGAALVGLMTLALLLVPGSGLAQAMPVRVSGVAMMNSPHCSRWAILTPMLGMLTVLFALLSLSTGAMDKFSTAALMQGQGSSLSKANLALTVFLFANALGVLSGGMLADKTTRHGLVAATAFAVAALLTAIVATGHLDGIALAIAFGGIGFLTGVITPSRDMLVRAAAPKGGEGKAFGIVSTGTNIGGTIGPVVFGWLLDQGHPNAIFWASVAFMSLTVGFTLMQDMLFRQRIA